MEEKRMMENIFSEAKDLMAVFQEMQGRIELNSTNLFFKSCDRFTIAKNLVPFLDIQDILVFRSTCKDVNQAVGSTVSLVSYYKSMYKKHQKLIDEANKKAMFKNIREVTEIDDIQMEIESLKNIKKFLTTKLFASEEAINIYKNDIDFLKSELNTQNEISEKLNETLSQTRNELEVARMEKNSLMVKMDEGNKRLELNNNELREKNKELMKNLEDLKQERNNYKTILYKLKLSCEEIKSKNNEKSEALKSIRNFFLTSTIFKIKNISDFEAEYNKQKKPE